MAFELNSKSRHSFDRPEKGVVTLDISVFTDPEFFNALRQKLKAEHRISPPILGQNYDVAQNVQYLVLYMRAARARSPRINFMHVGAL